MKRAVVAASKKWGIMDRVKQIPRSMTLFGVDLDFGGQMMLFADWTNGSLCDQNHMTAEIEE